MVDKIRRRKYAELLRHFYAGLITNVEYEKRVDEILYRSGRTSDQGLWAICHNVWITYDDLSTHKMTGKRSLPNESRKTVARWILFLYGDQEYVWPPDNINCGGWCLIGLFCVFSFVLSLLCIVPTVIACFLCVTSIAMYVLQQVLANGTLRNRMNQVGDIDYWPFIDSQQHAKAIKTPPLLNGPTVCPKDTN